MSIPAVTASVPYDPDLHPHIKSGPTGGQFAPKGKMTGPATKPAAPPPKKAPPKKASPAKAKPATKPASKPAHAKKKHVRQPIMRQGGAHNDRARVRDLQALLSELGLGKVAIDGKYGPQTEAAVMAAQRKLGLKPTGRAGSGLVRRLHDAHALSPCVPKSGSKVHAAEATEDVDAELIDTLPGDAFDVSVWSDGTLWLTEDGESGLIELDRADATQVVEALRELEDDDEVRVADWLTVRGVDGGAALEADDDEDVLTVDVSPADLDLLVEQLTAGMPVMAALGHDVTPGHDELHHYWTRGEGLAKWSGSPTPWTTLYHHLLKYMNPEMAKRAASKWYIEVFHFSSGSDVARVAHGKPPRGHLVGPG